MQILRSWDWKKRYTPPVELRKARSLTNVIRVKPIVPGLDLDNLRRSDVCLVTADAMCLSDDVKAFEAWGIPHDVYCLNRSLLYFERPVRHWAAVDQEEGAWFTEFANEKSSPEACTVRHTMGTCGGYDVYWQMDLDEENPHHKDLWPGSTGYFGVLTAAYMGYKKIVLAGMPLDRTGHFYEPPGTDGPCWIGACYTQWMDFKMQSPEADKVRSMSGYTAFMMGKASKEWVEQC